VLSSDGRSRVAAIEARCHHCDVDLLGNFGQQLARLLCPHEMPAEGRTMRRLMIAAMLLAVATVPTAALANSQAVKEGSGVPSGLRREWIEWAFGSSGNPLVQRGFCGEQVGGAFFLTVAIATPVSRRIRCEIPSGLPVLVTPGGAIAWSPTDGTTDSELYSTLLNDLLRKVVLGSVRVKLDGELLPRGPLVIPDPFNLSLEPGNFIQTYDPNVTGHSTLVMEGWWFTYIRALTPGAHVLIANDRFRGLGRFRTVFEINVVY
jgi:hypothetical protein